MNREKSAQKLGGGEISKSVSGYSKTKKQKKRAWTIKPLRRGGGQNLSGLTTKTY